MLSGVNRGQNVAEDVTYSGTIAAAMEGTLLGIPSMALSQAYGPGAGRKTLQWGCAEQPRTGPLIEKAAGRSRQCPKDILVNINFPDCAAPERVAGVAITVQGKRDTGLMRVEEREDGRGNPYYWVGFAQAATSHPGLDTDLDALSHQEDIRHAAATGSDRCIHPRALPSAPSA